MSSAYENAMSDLQANNYSQEYPPKRYLTEQQARSNGNASYKETGGQYGTFLIQNERDKFNIFLMNRVGGTERLICSVKFDEYENAKEVEAFIKFIRGCVLNKEVIEILLSKKIDSRFSL